MSDRPSVFILSIDSLRRDRFEDAMADIANSIDPVVFPNTVSSASQTISAMPGLSASLYHDSFPTWGFPNDGSRTNMAEVLQNEGYETALFTDNYLFGVQYNHDRGFTSGNLGRPTLKKRLAVKLKERDTTKPLFKLGEWTYFNLFKPVRDAMPGDETFYRSAEDLNANAMRWLDREQPETFLCWVHYMDTHHPFEPPQEYMEQFEFNEKRSRSELGEFTRKACKSNGEGLLQAELEDVDTAYDACCAYLHDEMTRFIDELVEKSHFDPDEDILVLTSDHGQCLDREKGVLGHTPPAFWEEIMNVPLAISRPDWGAGTVDGQVNLIDMMPTVLDAVGAPIPDDIDGEPSSDPKELPVSHTTFVSQWLSPGDGEIQTYRGVRSEDGWKLFGRQIDGEDEVVLTKYDVDDPENEELIYKSRGTTGPRSGEAAERWDDLLEAVEAHGPALEIGDDAVETSTEVREHLKSLGYVE